VRERDGKRSTTWWPNFRVIDTGDVVPDPDVAAAVATFAASLDQKANIVIAKTAIELDSRTSTVRTREAAIGNLFADAMRTSMRADAAVINGGGIRQGKLYEPGSEIKYSDILAELPFNNRVIGIEIEGRELKRAMENGLALLPASGGRFPQVSGIKLEYDPRAFPRNRVLSMQVAGAPLDETKLYRVAVLDFLARGGDDYTMFREASRVTPDNDAPLLANEVVDYIKRIGTVTTGVEGRVLAR
jgi:2',3'-cyclic-nucleotide 2'-phosphodiesterase (5'-nucleotidase family)